MPLQLTSLLHETLTPRLEKMGLTTHKEYLWYGISANEIRLGFKYYLLKGQSATFAWGVCLDFLPLPSGNSIKYYRTGNSFALQLFEFTDEYAGSFRSGQLKNGTVVHGGLHETKKSIEKLFNAYEERIFTWFKKAGSLPGLIEIAQHQASASQLYELHSPPPAYILAFLLAKNGRRNEAAGYFEALPDSYFNDSAALRAKLMQKLLGT